MNRYQDNSPRIKLVALLLAVSASTFSIGGNLHLADQYAQSAATAGAKPVPIMTARAFGDTCRPQG